MAAPTVSASTTRVVAVAPAIGWPQHQHSLQSSVIGGFFGQETHNSIVVEAESNLDRHLEVVDAAFLDVPSH